MALWRSKGARKDAVRGTNAIEVRKSDATLFTGPGVLPGAASPLVAGTSGWAYLVGAAGFVTSRGASDGVHWFGNDGAVSVGATGAGSTVPVAPGAGLQRIDVIWVRHPAAGENSDTSSEPVFGVTSGTPAPSPTAPPIPPGALELARNTMTSSATSTASAGNSITQSAARTWLAAAPAGVPAAVSATDPGTESSGTAWARDDVLGVYQFRAIAGRQYRLVVDGLLWNSRDANARFEVTIGYSTDGSLPGGAHPKAAATQILVPGVGTAVNGRPAVPLSGVIPIAATGLVRAALIYRIVGGTGAGTPISLAASPRQLYAQDMGPVAPAAS